MPSMKRCPGCSCLRAETDFAVDRTKASGRKSRCKSCDAESSRQYYEDHREEVIARVKSYQEASRG